MVDGFEFVKFISDWGRKKEGVLFLIIEGLISGVFNVFLFN